MYSLALLELQNDIKKLLYRLEYDELPPTEQLIYDKLAKSIGIKRKYEVNFTLGCEVEDVTDNFKLEDFDITLRYKDIQINRSKIDLELIDVEPV